MAKVSPSERPARVEAHGDPRMVAVADGRDLMVVRVRGEFPPHVHEDVDDAPLVIEGRVEIDPEGAVGARAGALGRGELLVVPAGVRHRPRAEAEAEAQVPPIGPRGLPDKGDPARVAPKAPIRARP